MEEKIISTIAAILNIPTEELSLETEIGEPDEWDSLNNLQIFTTLEQIYSIKIPAESLIDLEDISDIVKLIKELV